MCNIIPTNYNNARDRQSLTPHSPLWQVQSNQLIYLVLHTGLCGQNYLKMMYKPLFRDFFFKEETHHIIDAV